MKQDPAVTISEALANATRSLQHSSPSARIDSQALLCHTLDCNSAYLLAWPDKTLSAQQAVRFAQMLDQRKQGTPVAYLTGRREFWSLDLEVTPATLIPRAETETLVEFVVEQFESDRVKRVLDLGTGSGAIALAIASERPGWEIVASDASVEALKVAQANAKRLGLNHVSFLQSNWYQQLDSRRFDIIISNPPYVAEQDHHLDSGDVRFEPRSALASGSEGMDDIHIITRLAPSHLEPNGWLILEHGFEQQQQVENCMRQAGFADILSRSDLAKNPRMTAGIYLSS